MEKKDIIEFFDRCAPTWDAEMIKSDAIIGKILDNAEVTESMDVLDVACGTGVMFDYYLARGVASVTGIDIAPEMAKIAAEKYANEPKVQVICGDVEEYSFDRKFDRIVVYNAFPHFPEPTRLIGILAGLLKENGRLTIAHGASRETIDNHHKGSASKVSNGLMAADSLKKIFDPYFDVEVMISNRYMYQVSGARKDVGSSVQTQEQVSVRQLVALISYMEDHNAAHAGELADLARQLEQAGNCDMSHELLDAVALYQQGNQHLNAVLAALKNN